MGLAYLGFGQLDKRQDWLQTQISALLEQPVTLNSVSAYWDNWIPTLTLEQLSLTDTSGATHSIRQVQVRFDPVASLLQWHLITDAITINGGHLGLRNENGQISFAGIRNEPTSAPVNEEPAWLRWLLQQTHLRLQDAEIKWFETRHAPLLFSAVNLEIVRQNGQHSISGELQFPPHESELPLIVGSGLRMHGGGLSFSSLSQWQQGSLLSLKGNVQVSDTRLLSKGAEIFLANVQGELDIQRASQGWRIDINEFTFDTEKYHWPQSQLNLASIPEEDGRTRLEIQLGFLQLNELAPLLAGLQVIPANVRQAITSLEPIAELHATQFSYVAGKHWRLRTHVTNWRSHPWNGIPGLSNWSGVLALGPEDGSLSLHAEDFVITVPELYSDKFTLNSLNGEINWAKNEQGWTIATNGLYTGDAYIPQIKVAGAIILPNDDSAPYSDLTLKLKNAEASQIYRYFPDREKGVQRTMQWLREGLLKGQVAEGKVTLKGPLDAIPFDNDEGVLRADFDMRNLDIEYHSEWPPLEEVDATLVIDKRRIVVSSEKGSIYDVSVSNVEAFITDFLSPRPRIRIRGKASGPATDGLKFINNSPLRERVGINDLLTLDGQVESILDLDLSLYKAGKDKLKGEVLFPGNTLNEKKLGLTLTEVQGKLKFSEDDLYGDDIQARFLEEPVVMQVRNLSVGEGNITRASLRGQATPPFLRKLSHALASRPELYLPWINYMQGESTWQGHFDFSARYPTSIDIITDLVGMDIQLPSPVGKGPETPRRLRVSTHTLENDDARMRIRHADIFDAELDMDTWYGSIMLGGKVADYDEALGLDVKGYLPALSLTDWWPYVDEWWSAQPPSEEDSSRINALDTLIDQVEVGGFYLNEARLRAQFGENQVWSAFLSSEEALGQIQYDEDKNQVRAELARLHLLTKEESEEDEELVNLEPTHLPTIEIFCEDCRYNNFNLGQVTLSAHPNRIGWRIDDFSMQLGDTRLIADGLWSRRPYADAEPVYHSHIRATLESDNFGNLLSEFGYQS
ncbi:MAG: DUF3971 domain-containing protein, partial [Pseudomonadota bacterium]